MGEKTGITWTSATWNPVTGCSHVSAGCEHCYAETLSLRHGWSKKPWTAPNAAENVVLHPERLDQPLRWRAAKRIFVNSMSDLFHEQVPTAFIAEVFAMMAMASQHQYQVLTKRPEVMRDMLLRQSFVDLVDERMAGIAAARGYCKDETEEWPLPNVWLGVSIEQDGWTGRADLLRDTPAAVRFISAEPLLEPLPSLSLRGIDWLIFGGESAGPEERRMVERCTHVYEDTGKVDRANCGLCDGTGWWIYPWAQDEARRLLDMCRYQTGATSFFLKQWGGPDAEGRRKSAGRPHLGRVPGGGRMSRERELLIENARLAARCVVLTNAVNTALGWIGGEQPDAFRVGEARSVLRSVWERVHEAEMRVVSE